ncbi:MAG: hypothetical protein IJC51_01710, partial [Eggerthellaceae bacterium]|nr:hypothetical protein [Eggerthellaceae bacterium]
GSLANLIASAASLAFCLALTSAHATSETAGFSLADALFNFLLMMAVVGFAFALINGIPLRVGGLDNDGHNAWELARNKEAARAFWMQMKVNEQLSKNVRLKDMPDEWFAVPSDDAMRNSIIAAVGVFACNRHMDAHRFDEAESLIRHLLESSCNMAGLHRNLLVCDLVYLKLIGNNGLEAPEELGDLLNAEQRQFMKSMKDFPSVVRTEYALALLQERDAEKASAALAHFESIAKRYPYPTDIESEREYVQIASEQALRNEQPS